MYRICEVPPNIQRHMLRVAAVGERLCRGLHAPAIDCGRVTTALLVHDLGNIVKCDYDRLPWMLEEEEGRVDHWRAVQARHRARFGADEGLATRTLAREVGIDAGTLELLDRMAFERNDETAAGDDLEAKIASYADQRVGPRGVVSLAERFAELQQRYGAAMRSAEAALSMAGAFRIEAQLAAACDVSPASIDDAEILPIVASLRAFPV